MTDDARDRSSLIRTREELRQEYGPVNALSENKVMPFLDAFCRDFVALSPFLILASSDGEGSTDASPRGDAPGFVAILDDRTLLIPDRPGNRRVDSFNNIVRAPGVGLIFFVPGINETLRVSGRASVTRDFSLLEPLAAQGKVPKVGLKIDVERVFFHCGKALIRSKLWDTAQQIERSSFPSLGRILAEQTGLITVDELETIQGENYRTTLY